MTRKFTNPDSTLVYEERTIEIKSKEKLDTLLEKATNFVTNHTKMTHIKRPDDDAIQ